MSDVHAWLDTRTPQPPTALRAHIDRAIDASAVSPAAGVPAALAEAGLHALGVALDHCDERTAAPDLLAADALLTYAMEAAAEIGGGAVEAVAEAYGTTRLAALLAEEA